MPLVASDNDLPKSLNTTNKQVKMAKTLVAERFGKPAKRVDRVNPQGMFSRTFFVTLTNGHEVVIQFRTEPLDLEAFKTARSALGAFVPDAQQFENPTLEEEGAWVYCLERLPGKIWHQGIAGKGAQGRITVSKSLGRVFSKGYLDVNSKSATPFIRARLEGMLASSLEDIQPYKPQLRVHLDNVENLARLPLWVAHYDLNDVNVLVDEKCEVTGLIDWELSTPLPFGLNFGRVHTIAGEYTGGEFYMPEHFEEAERGFWQELLDGISDVKVRKTIQNNMDLVQDAVILGAFMNCFIQENPEDEVGCSPVTLRALPKFLTYRIPFVRGDDPPYRV